ncbi:hypothetical protein [Cyclobacterium plantarum]|uniref:hypothetical protein n=1 Tax=Cyclobacterium plantarum TaxID=2716263 RepID=UPI003F7135C8
MNKTTQEGLKKDPELESPISADPTKSRRLLSIDALRGFDMLLIAGGVHFWSC